MRAAVVTASVLATAGVGACARQGTPPGGPEDRRPPVVVSTVPDTFAALDEPFRGPVVFRFDERISERVGSGTLDDAVIVSPRTGQVRASAGRDRIEVSMGGGFQPGLVYRVRLLPVVRDMFNNELRAPFEIVFSTGGDLTESAVAGLAWDRTTGEGVPELDVVAIAEDSTLYPSRTDSAGIYALRYLPPGRYQIRAWEDRNRNDEVDARELQGARAVLLNGPDTLVLNVGVLLPDTSAATLTRADVLDSLTLAVTFDDFFDPGVPSEQVSVSLIREDGEAPAIERLFHEHEYRTWVGEIADSLERLDSIAMVARAAAAERARAAADTTALPDTTVVRDTLQVRDTARVRDTLQARDTAQVRDTLQARDTTGAADTTLAVDTVVAGAAGRPGLPPALPPEAGAQAPRGRAPGAAAAEPTTPDGDPLPGRRLVVRLEEPLVPNTAYQLEVRGVTNLNGIPLGGGEAAIVLTPPADTAVAPDTGAVPDTGVVRDTIPPDTGSAAPRTDGDAPGRPTAARGTEALPFLRGRGP